ncbi:MAG: dephospho-CoA kinase [Arcobacter sp.]|nr:MAG: dephospho-CoA kinase [Arcobacter sp.]
MIKGEESCNNKVDNSFRYAIALTGGIATGKSTVSALFMSHGFSIIDADKIAHKLLDIHSLEIAKLFGNQYVENNIVLRKKLGSLIFNNENEKLKLENLIHPLIENSIIQEAKILDLKSKPYLIDIPLFFEKQHYNISKSIVVYTSKEIQIKRLMKRDNCTKQEALVRINNQMDIEKKKLLSTYIIDNSKDLQHLQEEVKRVKNLLI